MGKTLNLFDLEPYAKNRKALRPPRNTTLDGRTWAALVQLKGTMDAEEAKRDFGGTSSHRR